MITTIIVDFDDTLCLTEEAGYYLENEVFSRIGALKMGREVHRRTWGQPLLAAIHERSPGVDVQAFQKTFTLVMSDWVASQRIDAISEANLAALDELVTAGKQVFLLTSRNIDEMRHLLAPDHVLASRVKAMYYKETMSHHKPDPRAFDNLLQEHNLTPDQCVYVGDSPSDAAAAKGKNMHFIASLEAGIRTKDDFDTYPVDNFIDCFADLPALVATLPS
jgi:HAD superfamily hydrolase (TIGR01509 family)